MSITTGHSIAFDISFAGLLVRFTREGLRLWLESCVSNGGKWRGVEELWVGNWFMFGLLLAILWDVAGVCVTKN